MDFSKWFDETFCNSVANEQELRDAIMKHKDTINQYAERDGAIISNRISGIHRFSLKRNKKYKIWDGTMLYASKMPELADDEQPKPWTWADTKIYITNIRTSSIFNNRTNINYIDFYLKDEEWPELRRAYEKSAMITKLQGNKNYLDDGRKIFGGNRHMNPQEMAEMDEMMHGVILENISTKPKRREDND